MNGILGYRAFRADPSKGAVLRSWIMQDTVWGRGVNQGRCLGGALTCPGPPSAHTDRTGCGFHAFAHLDGLRIYLRHQEAQEARMTGRRALWCPDTIDGLLCGVVLGLGRVQLGTVGWRSTHAAVAAIFGATPLAEALADRYCVPLLPIPTDYARSERYLAEWGLTYNEALTLPSLE